MPDPIRSTTIGKLYFAYAAIGEQYDPTVHSRQDEVVRSLSCRFAENQAWSATIGIVTKDGAPTSAAANKPFIFISCDDSTQASGKLLLYCGKLRPWPTGRPNGEMAIDAISLPIDLVPAKNAITAGYDPDPWGLIVGLGRAINGNTLGPGDYKRAEDRLAASNALIHWSRFNRPGAVIDLIGGDGTVVDLGSTFIDGTIDYKGPSDPITTVYFRCTATWEQASLQVLNLGASRANGTFGLGQAGLGPGQYCFVNDKPWARDWYHVGHRLGDWTVIGTGGQRLSNPPNGLASYTDAFQAEIQANKGFVALPKGKAGKEVEGSFPVQFRRYYEEFELQVQGIQRAKRKEVAQWTLNWSGQDLGVQGKTETIAVTLGDLRSHVGYAAWVAGGQYAQNAVVEVDGLLWECAVAHTAGQGGSAENATDSTTYAPTFYGDIRYWNPVLVDYTALGGPGWSLFFGQPEQISGPDGQPGGTLVIDRQPTPGVQMLRFLHDQGIAKMAMANRCTVSFDVPFDFVKTLDGREVVTISGDQVRGGTLSGKVIAMSFTIGQDGPKASITLGCNPGADAATALPGMDPYVVVPLDPVTASFEVAYQNDLAEALLAQAQFPAVNPQAPPKVVEVDAAGNEKADNGQAKGYNLAEVIETFNPSISVSLSPLQGAKELPLVLVPNGGANGVFTWSGPKNVDLGTPGVLVNPLPSEETE